MWARIGAGQSCQKGLKSSSCREGRVVSRLNNVTRRMTCFKCPSWIGNVHVS